LTSNLYDNVQTLSKLIGIYTHPLFKVQPKFTLQDENQPLIAGNVTETQLQQQNHQALPQNLLPEKQNLGPSQTAIISTTNLQVSAVDKIEQNFIIFNNVMIDYGTVKILNYVWALSKFDVLK